MNNTPLISALVSLVHVPMAGVVWSTLFRRWHRVQLSLWISGALIAGLCGTLMSQTGQVPRWVSDDLANALMGPAFALRMVALRLDLGLPTLASRLTLLMVVQHLVYLVLRQSMDWLGVGAFITVLWPHVLAAIWVFAFAWHGMLVGRHFKSRSGWLLAAAECAFGITLLVRLLAMAMGWTERTLVSNDWAMLLMICAGFFSALYGNLGYLGMVLDRSRVTEREARDQQLGEQLRREAAEQRSAALHQLLAERNQVLHMLAHEIRQPLHNAGGALQAATRALQTSGATAGPADHALQRAQNVLRHVQSVLDNTLASAQLFASDATPEKVDTDLDLLVHLTLGDLAAEQRERVQLDWQTTLHSVELEPGLVRLALRNLLNNAIEHGGAGVQVRLVVAEQIAPPALLLRVLDNGSALDANLLLRLQSAPATSAATSGSTSEVSSAASSIAGIARAKADGSSADDQPPAAADTFSRGLGLALARRVMHLHGGELRFTPAQPQGLEACLVFPLPDE